MAHDVVHPRVFAAGITVAGARRRVQRHVAPKKGRSSAASTSHPDGRRGGGKRGGGVGKTRSSGDDVETKQRKPTTRRTDDRSADTAAVDTPVPELTSAAPSTPSSGGGGGGREGGFVVSPPRLEPISARGSLEGFLRPPAKQQQLPKDASSFWTRNEIQGALTVGDVRASEDGTVVFEDATSSTTRGTPVETTPSTSANADEGDVRGAFAALLAKMFQHQDNMATSAAAPAPTARNGQRTRTSSPPAPLGFRSKKEATAAWTLGLLFLSYCHASSAGFILPALLPSIAGRDVTCFKSYYKSLACFFFLLFTRARSLPHSRTRPPLHA